MTEMIAIPQTRAEAVETAEGPLLVAPDGTVLERLQPSDGPCIVCGEPECDFDCDGEYDGVGNHRTYE